ncbi:hypothetical protein P5673_012061 [Acropora cervicornis]|uniref:PHD-type domain-containing protein n=1 Tax=Acropora cervicornis TaxID=6130 RepID=A0AAD9QNI1_ACRCE|nr:hypothetical protein P5673_012061 [Acropora cervicornis]
MSLDAPATKRSVLPMARRIEKKENQLKKTKQLENREGRPYSSRIGIDGDHAAQEIPAPPATQRMRLHHCPRTTILPYLILKHLEGVMMLKSYKLLNRYGKDEFSIYVKPCHVLGASSREKGVIYDLTQTVSGFTDSLPAFRELPPERKSHSQENLVQDLLCKSYEAHNALADVQTLYQLVNKFLNVKLLQKHSFKVSWVAYYQRFLKENKFLVNTLQPLLREKYMSASMAIGVQTQLWVSITYNWCTKEFPRSLCEKKLATNLNVTIERNKLLSNLFGSCYDDVLRGRDAFVCKVRRLDDNEDWLGCEKCGQFFHASCIGVNFAEALQDPVFYCP